MSDRNKASAFIFGLAGVLAIVLGLAYAIPAFAGVWNQGVPKPVDVACEDLNEFLFPDGEVPADLLPVYGNDATTEWSESWSSGEWAKPSGGKICIRTIDDPSCVAQGGCAAPVASGGGSAPVSALPTAWGSIAGGTIYIAVGGSVSMGVAPPCSVGTLEIRVTSPLTVSLSGPVPQAVTVTNPAVLGAVPFSGSFSVDTRCV